MPDQETGTPPPVTATHGPDTLVQITAEGDSLFGKAFKFVEEVGEKIKVIILTEVGEIEALFEKKHVQPVKSDVVSPATVAEVGASNVATAAPATPANTETTLAATAST